MLGAKLRALLADAPPFGAPDLDRVEMGGFPLGASALDGERAWILLDRDPTRALGPALAWAGQRGVGVHHLLVDDPADAGVLARRAAQFAPAPRVWTVVERTVHPIDAAPVVSSPTPPEEALDLVATLAEADLDIVIEHGQVTGEVLGLEVARVIVDEGGARIEVGVGHHDREAFGMVHGDLPTPAALSSVVEVVRTHRCPGPLTHPLSRLASERWLRHIVVHDPALVDAVELTEAEPTIARSRLDEISPAIAVGVDRSGAAVVVACSTGVDLDLVPAAADARAVHAPGARLVLVVPERDAQPVTERLAAALVDPATVVTVPDAWRR